MVQIIQYRNKCIGCNACAEVAPNRWVMSRKDGKCILVGGKQKKDLFIAYIPEFELYENQKAAEACPVNIIQVKKV